MDAFFLRQVRCFPRAGILTGILSERAFRMTLDDRFCLTGLRGRQHNTQKMIQECLIGTVIVGMTECRVTYLIGFFRSGIRWDTYQISEMGKVGYGKWNENACWWVEKLYDSRKSIALNLRCIINVFLSYVSLLNTKK